MRKKVGTGSCLTIVLGAIFLLALIVYLCIPHAPKTAAELCGTYVLDCELAHEELVLRPDRTFTQTATIKANSEVISSTGKWSYAIRTSYGLSFGTVLFYSGSNEGFIELFEWPDKFRPDYAKPTGSSMPAEYLFGQLILGRADSWPEWKKIK